jgi:hypothetical protein
MAVQITKGVTFGFSIAQLQLEVPKIIKVIYKTIQWVSTIFGTIVFVYFPVTASVKAEILLILLVSNKVISSFCQFFGIPDPGDVTVNANNSEQPLRASAKSALYPVSGTDEEAPVVHLPKD